MTLIGEYFTSLEAWVKDRAYFNIEGLTEGLQANLSDHDRLWAAMEQLQLITTDQLAYKMRLTNINKIITSMEDEVMLAPAAINPTDKDTYQERNFLVHAQRTRQEEAIDAFSAWEFQYKRLKAEYDLHANSDGTPITKN